MPAASAPMFAPWKRNLAVCVFGSFTTIVAMTLLIPFLPLYVHSLGVKSTAGVTWWSGVAFAATFLSAALVAPLWGRLSDRYGRKLMLVRASLGMAISMSLMGLATQVWQLVALRLLVGLMGGYASGSNIMVATQTPREKTGWALGVLAAGTMAGNLAGPLLGGFLTPLIGIRMVFFMVGGLIFIAFLATAFLMQEDREALAARRAQDNSKDNQGLWSIVVAHPALGAMLATGCLLMLANMSIEPIITVYISGLAHLGSVSNAAGIVMAATALGSIISAPWLGRLADRVGAWPVIIGCLGVATCLLVPQALVTAAWQLTLLRFLMGLALGGLLPAIASVIRQHVPASSAGTALGFSVSAQYLGQVAGPLLGGYAGGHVGMRSVFIYTCVLLLAGMVLNLIAYRRSPHSPCDHAIGRE